MLGSEDIKHFFDFSRGTPALRMHTNTFFSLLQYSLRYKSSNLDGRMKHSPKGKDFGTTESESDEGNCLTMWLHYDTHFCIVLLFSCRRTPKRSGHKRCSVGLHKKDEYVSRQ